MHPYRSAAPRRTPPPDTVGSQRGAYQASPFSDPQPDSLRSQRGAYPAVGSFSPPDSKGFQRTQRSAATYPIPRQDTHNTYHSFSSTSARSPPPLPPRPQAPDAHYTHHAAPPRSPPRPNSDIQANPSFIIIGLFALRLTLRLISRLDPYPQRSADIFWLETFLAPYPPEYALAKLSGAKREEYVVSYEDIVGRMKRQARYPVVFMAMNPDRSMRQQGGPRREVPAGEMTDLERLDIVDFCDAAGEWGSVVPIPAKEADRMIELAEQRKVADLEERSEVRDGRYVYET